MPQYTSFVGGGVLDNDTRRKPMPPVVGVAQNWRRDKDEKVQQTPRWLRCGAGR